MPTDAPILLDACVLAPFAVCDLFLRLAEEPRLYVPRWSEEILAEVHRTQVGKLGWPESLADHWRQEVSASFPEALVTGYEPLLERCENHEKDRHVLAAAVKARALAIVTFNLRHFPKSALEPHNVAAVHPSSYLIALYDRDAEQVLTRIEEIAATRGIEPVDALRRLRAPLPRFADHVAAREGWSL